MLDWGYDHSTEEEKSASPCSTHSKTRDFIKKGRVEQGQPGFGMSFAASVQ